jgi:hypothetical protein
MRFTLWRKQAFGLKKRRRRRRLLSKADLHVTPRKEFLALISATRVQHKMDKSKKKSLCN